MTIKNPFKQKADFEHLRQVIMRETKDGPVPIIEMMVDGSIMGRVTGIKPTVDEMTELPEIFISGNNTPEEAAEKSIKFLELIVAFNETVGYDGALGFPSVPRPRTPAVYSSGDGAKSSRPWQNEHTGLIPDRAAFEAFNWPDITEVNVGSFDFMAGILPPGMKIQAMYMGVFEDLRSLMGFESMAFKSIEEPELLGDILEQLTVLAVEAIDKAAAHPATGAVFYADDMGFKTNTMLSPDFFREWIIPRQQRIASACHKHGKPFLFHSCGYIETLMEDLIETVKIDGLHSFQDVICPVEEVYRRYSDRISILGGVDVGLLAAGTPDQIRARVRQILDVCGTGGGFALGSGNSVTNYCKIENYYAMIDEARAWNEEKGFL
jgi:uroporphyrinogen decarboxylase